MELLTGETTESGRYRVRGVAFVATAMLVLTACGSGTTIGGRVTSATSSSTSAASSSTAAVQPDPGNYPTTPRPALGAATTEFAGRLLDAQRMAGFVTGAWEVDPSVSDDYASLTLVKKSAAAVFGVGAPQPVTDALERHGFVNGFGSARQTEDKTTILRNLVLRFPDPGAAADAAADVNQAEIAAPASGSGHAVVPIPGHPDALASNDPWTEYDTKVEWKANLMSLTPHGPFLLVQLVQSTDSLDRGLALAAKTLDLQIPLIDQFTPTPQADFPSLPKDPSGQLARTLPVADEDATVENNATFDRRGHLHYQIDPVGSSKALDEDGVDVVTVGLTTVYRAADAPAAAKLADTLAAQVIPLASGPATPVTGIPGSRCLKYGSATFTYCVATADRYTFELQTAQAPAAAQMLAAQYLMLKAK